MNLPSHRGASARAESGSRVARLQPEGDVSVGVDVGGTFTDIITFDSSTGTLEVRKFPTSRIPSLAISRGLRELATPPDEISLFTHATTMATNALLTHSGLARAALVTNDGFRDILEIGRQRRPELYNLETRRPPPLVERKHRFTVKCRVGADGSVLEDLARGDAGSVARRIIKGGFDSVAVSFLNSYLNPEHERLMREVLRHEGFRGHVSISSEVDREYREFERTSTTVVNAVLAPMTAGYLSGLQASLHRTKVRAPVYVMNSDGGVSTVATASARPVMTIESGPAAGVVASSKLAQQLGLRKALTFDMGGTTAKAGTVVDGEPDITREFEAAGRTHSGRSIRGSGYAVRGSFIDIAEVSAGGGTVAWLDDAGHLQVGPESAGSDPGPACYGRGGTKPTVTDANVATGRLNPEHLLGGEMPIDARLATRSLRKLSAEGESDVAELAKGVIRLVNDDMAKAISIVSVERGRDPREFTMVAFGGAGPIHSCDLADEMGIREIVIPVHAGLFSAFGLIVGDLTRSFSAPVMDSPKALKRRFDELEDEAQREMEREGFRQFRTERFLEARYVGQSHELILPYGGDEGVREAFDRRHKALYGYSSPDPMQIVNIGVRARVAGPEPAGLRQKRVGRRSRPTKREAWVGGTTQEVDVFTREGMLQGDSGRGPCIIEEYDSTLVVNPSWTWRAEEYGTRLER
ncbi:MAG: hydantoinase/oxoprolinase family protein [Nitrososphaerales archaeon]